MPKKVHESAHYYVEYSGLKTLYFIVEKASMKKVDYSRDKDNAIKICTLYQSIQNRLDVG